MQKLPNKEKNKMWEQKDQTHQPVPGINLKRIWKQYNTIIGSTI